MHSKALFPALSGPLHASFACSLVEELHHSCTDAPILAQSFGNFATSFSLTLLEIAWPDDPKFRSLHSNKTTRYTAASVCCLLDHFLPICILPSRGTSATDVLIRMVAIQTQTAIRKSMQHKHHLLEIPDFSDIFSTPAFTFWRDDPCHPNWGQ